MSKNNIVYYTLEELKKDKGMYDDFVKNSSDVVRHILFAPKSKEKVFRAKSGKWFPSAVID